MTKCRNIGPMAKSSVSKAANMLRCHVAWYSCIYEAFACQLQHASSNLSRPEDSIGCRSVYLATRNILLLTHGLQDLPAHKRGFVHALAALRLWNLSVASQLTRIVLKHRTVGRPCWRCMLM